MQFVIILNNDYSPYKFARHLAKEMGINRNNAIDHCYKMHCGTYHGTAIIDTLYKSWVHQSHDSTWRKTKSRKSIKGFQIEHTLPKYFRQSLLQPGI